MGWKLDDNRAIWPQLKEYLTKDIIIGKYPMGGAFPTVRDLAQEAGVNRNTMQRALSELESEGLVITNRTSGRTVTDDKDLIERVKINMVRERIEEFIREMEAIGYTADEIVKVISERGVEEK